MSQLPNFQNDDKDFQLMQNSWSSKLNPLIANPMNSVSILKNVVLAIGSNTINHKLGKKLTGWQIVRQRASATIYDNQDNNQSPALTLVLISSGAVTIDLAVF